MSYANGTQFYNLPQTVGTDKRDWFDTNSPFAAIDAALHAAVVGQASDAEAIATINSKLTTDEADIAALQTASTTQAASISALQTTVNGQATQIADVRQDAEDMITANNEGAAATSTRAYAIGDYFIYNDVLYKATAAIAVGDTIVPNTNCEATNVDTELTQVNTSLADISQIAPDIRIDNTGRTNGQMLFMLSQQVDFSKVNVNTKLEIGTNVFALVTLDSTNQHLRFSRNDLKSDGSVRIINANIQNDANVYLINEGGTFTDVTSEAASAPFLIYY